MNVLQAMIFAEKEKTILMFPARASSASHAYPAPSTFLKVNLNSTPSARHPHFASRSKNQARR